MCTPYGGPAVSREVENVRDEQHTPDLPQRPWNVTNNSRCCSYGTLTPTHIDTDIDRHAHVYEHRHRHSCTETCAHTHTHTHTHMHTHTHTHTELNYATQKAQVLQMPHRNIRSSTTLVVYIRHNHWRC